MYRVIQIDDDHFVFYVFRLTFSWKGSSTLYFVINLLIYKAHNQQEWLNYNLFIYKFIFNFLFNTYLFIIYLFVNFFNTIFFITNCNTLKH